MGYDMDPSVKHRIQERPDPREQLLKSLNTINKAIESGFESLERHNPSVEQTTKYPSPVDTPSTSASTVYNIGPSAKHRNQKWLAAREQLLTNFKTMKKVVESSFEALEEYSPPVPSSEQTTKKSKDSDAVEEYTLPVPSSEQTTKESKDSDAVDKPSPTMACGIVSPPEYQSQNWDELAINLNKINAALSEVKEDTKIHSPSVPSPELGPSTSRGDDIDPSERRSGEQPHSQVLSSEQTRKRKGANDNVADDTRKRRKSPDTNTDG